MVPDEELLSRAINIVSEVQVGLLCTCDQGAPRARWMSALSEDGLRTLHTLSAEGTRKIEELAHNPRVCWVFTWSDYADIVTLQGSATVHHGALAAAAAWDRLTRAARAYAVGSLSAEEHLELTTIRTTVERIEIISADYGVVAPREIALGQALEEDP